MKHYTNVVTFCNLSIKIILGCDWSGTLYICTDKSGLMSSFLTAFLLASFVFSSLWYVKIPSFRQTLNSFIPFKAFYRKSSTSSKQIILFSHCILH